MHEVPVHVIPCLRGRLSNDTSADVVADFYGSIFPAIWSFQLALRARGWGDGWKTLLGSYYPGANSQPEAPHS